MISFPRLSPRGLARHNSCRITQSAFQTQKLIAEIDRIHGGFVSLRDDQATVSKIRLLDAWFDTQPQVGVKVIQCLCQCSP